MKPAMLLAIVILSYLLYQYAPRPTELPVDEDLANRGITQIQL